MGLTASTEVKEVKEYCKRIVWMRFYGQTSSLAFDAERDESIFGRSEESLGTQLERLDKCIRKAKSPSEFDEEDSEFVKTLEKIAELRRNTKQNETVDQCFRRLKNDSIVFGGLYRKRNVESQILSNDHFMYWGTRQQMLFGNVVTDWMDTEEKLDPIFGVLLNPTGGRVGPGDTGWFHNALYDDCGTFAYHTVVHDAFGYLKTEHDIGPGYDYLEKSIFGDDNPLAGQFGGLIFWNSTLDDMESSKAQYIRI